MGEGVPAEVLGFASFLAVALIPALLFTWRPTSVASRWLTAFSWAVPAAVLVLMIGHLQQQATAEQELETSYAETWRSIDRAAQSSSTALEASGLLDSELRRLDVFDLLSRPPIDLSLQGPRRSKRQGLTVLVFDPLGEAVAWRGPGLLHEPDFYSLPDNGSSWTRGHTAVTLWTVRSFGPSGRWRLVAGTSLALNPFPFAPGAMPEDSATASLAEPGADAPVWVLAASTATPPDGVKVVTAGPEHPVLWIQPGVAPAFDATAWIQQPVRQQLASVLGILAALWAAFHLLWPVDRSASSGRLFTLTMVLWLGVLLAGLVAGAGLVPAAVAGAMAALLTAQQGWTDRRDSSTQESSKDLAQGRLGPNWTGAALGAVGFGLLVVASWWLQEVLGPIDLFGDDTAVAVRWAIRIALGAATVALFQSLPRRLQQSSGNAFLWGLGLLIPAAAVHDYRWPAWILGVVAAAFFGHWWSMIDRRSVLQPAGLALAASLLAALAWQSTGRVVLQHEIGEQYLPLTAPPSEQELADLGQRLREHFDSWVPDDEPLAQVPGGERWSQDDLAFELWLRSPLPSRDGLSAVHVITVDGDESSFSFGLPLADDGNPSLTSSRLRVPAAASWRRLIRGEALVYNGDDFWGQIQYFLLPRPGFRLEINEIEELERNLVREKPRGDMADGLPDGVEYGFFSRQGKAVASPWETFPPLPAEILEQLPFRSRLETPSGESRCWLRPEEDGITALFLPLLTPQQGLERVGFVAFGICGPLLLAFCLLWLIPESWSRLWTMIQEALRSYSKRLILVYTVLLLVPLVALNLILLRSFSERLQQEKLADAQRAMVSAREFLVSYLQDLKPGVLIETQVNRDLLEWMSDLVQHQVNLYWGSRIYRSSQEELFTSGLIPRRIPEEIFTRLTLLGHGMELRRQQTGDLTYLEVYAPLDVPGVVSSQQELFLSVPLLEQEEVAEQRLSAMSRRALLVTSALFILLTTVGRRLTRSFTRPIEELIGGTERIARGEPFPDIRPRETELSALAQAIDTMARQVDESRRGLLGEKRFVERVVANITSAVVSLDREHRVAFQNDVAAQLLGTVVGEPIDRRLAAEPVLAPLREFWQQAQAEGLKQERQVKLRPAGEMVDVREWTLTWVPVPGDTDPAALLVVDDDTEVMRGQRLEAWAEMARIIAHEIKNPLTPIQLSAEHLRQVKRVEPDRFDEIFDRCTDNILSNVEELRSIASEFSIYSRIPAAKMENADLAQAMAELAQAYRDAAEAGVEMVLNPPPEPVQARFDEKLLGRAVRNLLENAYRAAAAEGGTVELGVRAGAKGRFAEVEVRDSGPGVDPQKLKRIFEPYFSTYETGTGLGLAIVQRIVNEHGGEVEARNRPSGGLSVIIRIPLAVASDPEPGKPALG